MSFIIEVTQAIGSRSVIFKTEAPTADEALSLYEQAQRILRGEKREQVIPYDPIHFWPGWPGDPPRKPGAGEAAD